MPPLRRRHLHAGHRRPAAAPGVSRQALRWATTRGVISAVRQRGHAGALREHAGAGGVELDQLAHAVHQRGRQHQPAEAPAGHQEALGEAVATTRRSSGAAMSRKLGAQPLGVGS